MLGGSVKASSQPAAVSKRTDRMMKGGGSGAGRVSPQPCPAPSAQRPARSSAQPPRAPRGHADRGKAEAPRPHGTYGSPAPPSPGEQQQQGRETRTRTASSTAVTARASPRRAEQRALPTAAPAGPQAPQRSGSPAGRRAELPPGRAALG